MFPSRMGVIKLEVEKLPPSFHGWMKKKVGNMFSFFGICFHLT
jgi:hypothetical protein